MRHFMSSVAGVLFLSTAVAGSAFAQNSSTDRLQRGPIVSGTGEQRPTKASPPPGLPGAALNRDRVAPSEKAATDMPPTEALFDAINRGDIASARDSLARGADFNARNVLGLTPLDQSIDLSRNDITFLLLSLRGGAAPQVAAPSKGGARPVPGTASAPSAAPTKAIAATEPKQALRPVTAAAPRPVVQAQSPQNVGGGAPSPQSGFLGFGG
jgi:hypothetical protein